MIYNYNVFLYIAARAHFYRFLYVWCLFVATVTKGRNIYVQYVLAIIRVSTIVMIM